ncbi:MAG TPA: hypothetical protein VKY74_14725 [Chloroflexia bacterium]|nr:hypothetical protein [Chloroflexia bacterium]
MDQLVNEVAQKTGLPQDQAKQAVDAVISTLKQQLPAPIAGELDTLLAGGDVSTNVGNLAGELGGLLGKH